MASFTAGTTFVDGVSNDVTAAKLGNLVTNATPTSGFIQDRTAETVIATNDTLLIGDASDSNNLKRMTVANFTQTLPTAKVTTGTIETGTFGTTTSTAATITTGTIETGTFGTTTSTAATITTGTIPTLVATTLVTTGTGTAAAPAIVPTGDTNTGIFFPAADTIAFSEGGTEAMRIDASGRVGIGATTVGALLDIAKSDNSGSVSDFPSIRVTNTNSTLGNNTSTYNYARIDVKSGNGVVFADFGARYDSSYSGAYLGAESVHPLIFQTGGTERLRIDSSGKVLIGTTSNDTGGRLEVKQGSSETGIGIQSSGTDDSKLFFRTASGTYGGDILFNGSYLKVSAGATERMRIESSGNVLFGKATSNIAQSGVLLSPAINELTVSGGQIMSINRTSNDGSLVVFYQDGTGEGSISVAGTTVSYNGGHLSRWSQLPNGQRDPEIKKGTVLSNLDAMCEWRDADGNLLQNEQLNKVKISDVEGDSNTAGVFVNWDNDDQDNPYDLNMAMTGDMIIRIAQGTSVNRGDLLMSAGDGTAKPQGDDIIRSKTIAKVTSTNVTCTYEDGSYCVPCVLMAC
jgi:hypothetical protein